jgi:DNA-binding ferritin-like protein
MNFHQNHSSTSDANMIEESDMEKKMDLLDELMIKAKDLYLKLHRLHSEGLEVSTDNT